MTRSLALIGAGNWGKNLARNFHALGVLHTLCDSRKSVLDSYQKDYSLVNLTSDYKSILLNPEIKAIAIAAPAVDHFNLAKLALENGKHVYVEKPLCLSIADGEFLIKLANQNQLILMVGHLLQYHPCVIKLKEMVNSGVLGKLQSVVSNRLNLGLIRTEENALWSFAPHDISVILSLCGNQLPTKVRCTGNAYLSKGVADTTMTTLSFENDVRAYVYVSWLHPFKEQKLVVVGSSGMAVFDDTKSWDEKLVLYRNFVTWTKGNIPQANKSAAEKIAVLEAEPLKEECSHFIDCYKNNIDPKTNGSEGLRVLKVLQAAQESLNLDGEAVNPINHFQPTIKNYFVHSSSVIGKSSKIGDSVKIWHFSHIMDDSEIGDFCNIGQNVVISPKVKLGKNVKIQNNVSVYSGVECEDDVFLGPSMVFTNVMNPRSAVNRRDEYKKTLIKKGASVGANATILCGIELGEYCFVGAGAVVTKSIKPFAIVVGNPARQTGWMSRNGEKLDLPLFSKGKTLTATCPKTGELYRLKEDLLSLGNE